MKIVARRTGLSPHLIRMWERRYRAVVPARTPTGHRLYSDEDIERLTLLRKATLAGEAIGQIARLPQEELTRMVVSSSSAANTMTENTPAVAEQADYHVGQCLEAVRNFDSVNLEARLLRASVALGQQVFLDGVLYPLLAKTGDLWNSGQLKIAHEHLASAVIRSLLGSMSVTMRSDESGPLLLTTTPAGQMHEFGALMVAVIAASIGWRTAYLGPDLPAEDIAAAAELRRADAVAVSIVYPPDDPHLGQEMKKLARLLGSQIKIIAGGRAAGAYARSLDEINAIRIESLSELSARLNELRNKPMDQQSG